MFMVRLYRIVFFMLHTRPSVSLHLDCSNDSLAAVVHSSHTIFSSNFQYSTVSMAHIAAVHLPTREGTDNKLISRAKVSLHTVYCTRNGVDPFRSSVSINALYNVPCARTSYSCALSDIVNSTGQNVTVWVATQLISRDYVCCFFELAELASHHISQRYHVSLHKCSLKSNR